jgi:triacylglycerol esterase/lipase EstA (alpha/beta hydrolase family)
MPHGAPQRPVILVHGILGQRHLYWNLMRRRLEGDGFRVHEATLPYTMLGDIRIAAGTLKDKVDATLVGDKVDKVDLVCHSAGGLVARYYLKFLGGHDHVGHCILLGTPHQGTYFSYTLPLLHIARQARPGAHLLRELNEGPHPPVRLTNLWSRTDGIIFPPHHAQLEGADNVEIPWTHHWAFLLSGKVYQQIHQALLGPAAGRDAPATTAPA